MECQASSVFIFYFFGTVTSSREKELGYCFHVASPPLFPSLSLGLHDGSNGWEGGPRGFLEFVTAISHSDCYDHITRRHTKHRSNGWYHHIAPMTYSMDGHK